ncbi:MAG: SbcC/MukB-like Walker B domain-containing protein [Propionibacteriaceae bacterium]|nr:SbcC/MukB-like Walker B domain-containing protein [Propionibacteriaceae bacterium]
MSQHRLRRVQLVNWGTFDGVWSFDVPRRGLLLTGPSGAGKSSVLDAMASLLVRPARLKFNAAAQGTETGDRERSLVTYVLGAYKRETDAETGEVGTAFLRKGPTWSGVALTFDDGRGTVTTLLRLFHLRAGTTSGTDLKSMYVLAPEAVELLSVQPYVKDGVENRRLSQAFPGWDVFGADAYTGFANKFRRRLGLGSEQAQLLLHKTQSAKNLTNLDSLFRDFMLDAPDTFELAEQTVGQFQELTVAHAAVVDARRQVEALAPLRGLGEEHADATSALQQLGQEAAHLGAWLTGRQLADTEHELDRLRPRLTRFATELADAEAHCAAAEGERVEAQRALDGSAGAELGTLEELLAALRAQMVERREKVEALTQVAQSVGLGWPGSAAEVETFQGRVAALGVEFEAEQSLHRDALYRVLDRRSEAQRHLDQVSADLESLRRHGSNLDPRLLAARQMLAERLQVAESTLPFVGELVQVRASDAGWTGAIERVLGSFARTLVIPEPHYVAAAEIIDAQHLGVRLVYEKVTPDRPVDADEASDAASLVAKVDLADGPYRGWLADRLRRRFDYACVENPAEFHHRERAVTRAGQVKHSSTLHEKDDRGRVDDRRRWVLGFSIEAKERELVRLQRDAVVAVEAAERELDDLGQGEAERQQRRDALAQLDRIAWADLDLVSLGEKERLTQGRLDQLRRDHSDVPALELALERAKAALERAETLRREIAGRHDDLVRTVRTLETRLADLSADLADADPVPDAVAEQIAAVAAELSVRPDRLEIALREHMAQRRTEAERRRLAAEKQISRQMGVFKRTWQNQSSDWGEEVEFLAEYLEWLGMLERDGLPTFEKRFFDLLQNQARTNIGQLAMKIRGARREIRTRVDEVNKSLRLTEFSPGGHLQIDVRDRALPEVEQFLATLHAITSGSVSDVFASDNPEERTAAEERFALMKGILDRLGSADPGEKAWRDRCLDTRQHVQFQARVVDADGAQLDVFTGSGGRSGGERQKLVTFCLAAALRFQLAPAGQAEPTYALVVIDEAFDKADHRFTQAGLEVFTTFGFQMLLATPMKMLQTIDDYVGGVVMVTNDTGRRSQIHQLAFDGEDLESVDEVVQDALL